MRPILCKGGYPIPIATGRMEIFGFSATVNSTAAASRITLVDSEDFKIIPDDQDLNPVNNRRTFSDVKGIANGDAILTVMFPEPYKTIKGVTIADGTTNLVAGKNFVYVR